MFKCSPIHITGFGIQLVQLKYSFTTRNRRRLHGNATKKKKHIPIVTNPFAYSHMYIWFAVQQQLEIMTKKTSMPSAGQHICLDLLGFFGFPPPPFSFFPTCFLFLFLFLQAQRLSLWGRKTALMSSWGSKCHLAPSKDRPIYSHFPSICRGAGGYSRRDAA